MWDNNEGLTINYNIVLQGSKKVLRHKTVRLEFAKVKMNRYT